MGADNVRLQMPLEFPPKRGTEAATFGSRAWATFGGSSGDEGRGEANGGAGLFQSLTVESSLIGFE